MALDIVEYFGTAARPVTEEVRTKLAENVALGMNHVGRFGDGHKSYEDVVLQRIERDPEEEFDMTRVAGFAIGARKAGYDTDDDRRLPWHELSPYSIFYFREGHAYGSRNAADTSLSIREFLVISLDTPGKGGLQLKESAGLLGHIAGVHAVDLSRRGAIV